MSKSLQSKSTFMYVWWGCLAIALLFFAAFSLFDSSKSQEKEVGIDMSDFEKMTVDEKSKLTNEDWVK